jgi:hypothetical protein
MSADTAAIVIAVLLAVVCGVLIPWVGMRYLMRGSASGGLLVPNYRGRPVSPSLGLVWPFWAVGLLVGQTFLEVASRLVLELPPGSDGVARVADTPLSLPLFGVPFLLVVGVFALGLADDAFGASGPKGFRGHVGELRHGHLTTGLVKVIGIGGIALFYGVSAATGVLERSNVTVDPAYRSGLFLVAWLLAAVVIALSANLMNLLDLRPGRALKVYSAAVIAPAVLFAGRAIDAYGRQVAPFAGEIGGLALSRAEEIAVVLALVAVFFGPVFAVYRYDLTERAMLGDGGANTMGAIVGYLLTGVLSIQGLAVAAAALLALNLVSERVSFTRVIETTPLLAWLDRLGRGTEGQSSPKESSEAKHGRRP